MDNVAVVAATFASPNPQVRYPELQATINGLVSSFTRSSFSFKTFPGCRKRRCIQCPIHPGATLTLTTPHTIQEHKGDESPAKLSPPQNATVSKEGALRLTHRGFIVLVCLCDGRPRRPSGFGRPRMSTRRPWDAVARGFGRNTI